MKWIAGLTSYHAEKIQAMATGLQKLSEQTEDEAIKDLLLDARSKLDSAAARILYPQDYK